MAVYFNNKPFSFIQFQFPNSTGNSGNLLATEGLIVITAEDGTPLVVQGGVGGGSGLGDAATQECIPIYKQTDIAFQLEIETDTAQEALFLELNPSAFSLLLIKPTAGIDQASVLANILFDYSTNSLLFNVYRIGETKLLIYWGNGLPLFNNYLQNDLLKLAIKVTIGSDVFAKPSTLLHYTTSIFTTAIEYSCQEDSFQFYYCLGYLPNRIRLPFYLKSIPQFQDEESVYTRSDGSIKLLKSVTKKEYQGITDYLNASQHEKLKIALSHDTVAIDSKNYTGGIRKNGAYEIEVIDIPGDIEVGQAKFKALVTPYNVRNSNCEGCNSCSITLGGFSIVYQGLDSGNPYYLISWNVTKGTVSNGNFIKHEYSKDNGVTWFTILDTATVDFDELAATSTKYYLRQESASIDHLIRITPRCSDYKLGASYTVPFLVAGSGCNVIITDVTIVPVSDGQDGFGYKATWVNSSTPIDVILEVSLDNGATWITPQYGAFTGTSIEYGSIISGNADTAHVLRITPVCSIGNNGTPETTTYTP